MNRPVLLTLLLTLLASCASHKIEERPRTALAGPFKKDLESSHIFDEDRRWAQELAQYSSGDFNAQSFKKRYGLLGVHMWEMLALDEGIARKPAAADALCEGARQDFNYKMAQLLGYYSRVAKIEYASLSLQKSKKKMGTEALGQAIQEKLQINAREYQNSLRFKATAMGYAQDLRSDLKLVCP